MFKRKKFHNSVLVRFYLPIAPFKKYVLWDWAGNGNEFVINIRANWIPVSQWHTFKNCDFSKH